MENKSNIVVRQEIENRIYTIRGIQVMIDSDLAEIYGVETKQINRSVKRNEERFPEKFMFQLSENEWDFLRNRNETATSDKPQKLQTTSQNNNPNLKYQFGTSSLGHGGRRKLPFAFTEQGVAMLSAVLRSETAVKVSLQIMDAFVEMRKIMLNNAGLLQRVEKIETKLIENDANFERVFNALETKNSKPTQNIFFDGQIYDAYSFIVELIEKAEKDIVLIDNYVDNTVLDMFSKKKNAVEVRIITHSKSKLLETDVQKFNQQYPNLRLEYSDKMHDRFLFIDNTNLYHIGASIKDMGKKCFAFSLINDKIIINNLLKNL
jgi:phage regulator Rha-like protein